MLAKITSKHQVTIPKQFMEQFKDVEYFDLALKDGLLLMKPLKSQDTELEAIRAKIRRLGLKQNSVDEAIRWVMGTEKAA